MPNADAQSVRTTQGSAKTAAERGREVRQRLLTTAVELIPELGWNAVSTRILAQRAGLAPGLVHYHFESLQALLREASLASMREALQGIDIVLQQADTLEAGLEMLISALDAYSGNDRASLLFVEAYLASLRDARLSQELAGVLLDFRQRFADWLAAHGQADPAPTAAVLAAALDGVLLHRALEVRPTSPPSPPVAVGRTSSHRSRLGTRQAGPGSFADSSAALPGPNLNSSVVRQVLGRVLLRSEPLPVHRSRTTRKGTATP